MTFKRIYLLVVFSYLLIASLFQPSYASINEDLPQGEILIKCVYSNEFLCELKDEDSLIGARKTISKESAFIIEKKEEGNAIKNVSTGNYLYSYAPYGNQSEDKLSFNFNSIFGRQAITTNNYFDIIKKDKGYLIKSIKQSDYIFIGPNMPVQAYWGERKYVIANDSIHDTSYFTFIPYNFDLN